MGFFRPEYWSGFPFPSPGDLPDPGIEPGFPTLEADALTSESLLKKLEIELPYDPEIPLLSIHTGETGIERDTCTPVFIVALFTIARTWKQPKYPLTD